MTQGRERFALLPRKLTVTDGSSYWAWLVTYWYENGVAYHCRICTGELKPT